MRQTLKATKPGHRRRYSKSNTQYGNDIYKKGDDTPPLADSDLEKVDSRREGSVLDARMDEPSDYRRMGRWTASLIYITNQVGIGILSLPVALRTLGLIPGLVSIIGMGILVTYTAYVLLQFYRRYRTVLDCVDCFRIIGGTPFAIIVGTAFVLNLILTCSSAVITMSTALNSISKYAICTVALIAIPTIVSWLLCVPRKMTFLAHFGSKSTRAGDCQNTESIQSLARFPS